MKKQEIAEELKSVPIQKKEENNNGNIATSLDDPKSKLKVVILKLFA